MAFDLDTALKNQGSGRSFDLDKELATQRGAGGFNLDAALGGGKPDLKTAVGLRQTAEQFDIDTARLPKQGEDPNQIFSGGIVSDVFDTLNLLQHGVVGVVKGQSFGEGVKTRASFTDDDLVGGKGAGNFLLGVGLDIAFDPLTYIAPVSVLRKLGVLRQLKKVKGAAAKLPIPRVVSQTGVGQKLGIKDTLGDQLGTMFIYRYGQDPVYKELAERSILNKGKALENVVELTRPIAKLNTQAQQAIAAARKSGNLGRLSPNLYETARPAFQELDRLGREAVDLKLLSREVYEAHVGKYLPRLYRKYEDPASALAKDKVAREFFDSKVMSQTADRFKKRGDIPDEVREAMGEVLEGAYPTAKGMAQLVKAVENAKFFKSVNKLYASADKLPGFTKMPDTARLGPLSGKHLPDFIADDINAMIRQPAGAEALFRQQGLVGTFKFSKVILNPAAQARNMMSNMILNSFEGMPPGHPAYYRAIRELKRKGPIYREAQKQGLGLNTFASAEIGEFLTGPASRKLSQPIKDAMKKAANLYQKEEEWAKMAQYIYQTKAKGLAPEEAWKIAERATFNYAQVTPFIRHMRTSIYGVPFITFTYKATPQVAKTIVQNPQRVAVYGKVKNAIEAQTDPEELEAERATEPPWVRDGFYIKLPIKDEVGEGRSMYLDMTYIMPFGDLIGGNLLERDIDRETGLPESRVSQVAKQSLALQIFSELKANQDFYGNKIYKDSDSEVKQAADIGRYLFTTFTPPLAPDVLGIEGGFRPDGTRRPTGWQRVQDLEIGGVDAGGAQTRTIMQETLRNLGIKLNPVDLETQRFHSEEQEIKALRTLLEERGIMGSLDIPFVKDVNR